MRSLTLDTTSFTATLLGLLRQLPNVVSNSIWEHTPNPAQPKPTPQALYETRLAYITAKYGDKAFVQPLPPGVSPNEFLVRSITNGGLKGVLWALARKADPNTRTPVLPALILALQQDDRAPKTEEAEFPFAELLILNGANPVDPRTLPVEASTLSDAAKRYLQVKSDRAVQNAQSPSVHYSTPGKTAQGLGISNSSSSSSPSTSLGELNRTVSKLQKRLSSGGKGFRAQLSPPLDKDGERRE
jgi:Arf-GAP with SH3 domain, ANK repeat and PH domain-containing protein